MKTIRTAAHPTDDIARLARLMINVETNSRIYEWSDEKDAKSAPAVCPRLGFNSVTVDQSGVAPFTFVTLAQSCATVVLAETSFAEFLAAMTTLAHTLGGLERPPDRPRTYQVDDLTISRTGFTWYIKSLHEIAVDYSSMCLVLIDSDDTFTSAIAGREYVSFGDLFGPHRAEPTTQIICAQFADHVLRLRGDWLIDNGCIAVPAQIIKRGRICGFVIYPDTPQACLLPGYCPHSVQTNRIRIIWESLVPVHILLSLPADMPRWVPTPLPD